MSFINGIFNRTQNRAQILGVKQPVIPDGVSRRFIPRADYANKSATLYKPSTSASMRLRAR